MRGLALTLTAIAHQFPLVPRNVVANNPLLINTNLPDEAIKPGTELRILCVGDSITQGFLSDTDGGDGNGYRLRLRDKLHYDHVVFAGTEFTDSGSMTDGYYAAWPGKTISYISDHVGPSLRQNPNVILVHAGTNDMNPNRNISVEDNDPIAASRRLGQLIDKIIMACPNAVVLVAMIINTCNPLQAHATELFQMLTPTVVQPRLDDGHHILAVNFTEFPMSKLRDCVHPTNEGYELLGDYWYNALMQVPKAWFQPPKGRDPDRSCAVLGCTVCALGFLFVLILNIVNYI